MHRMTKINRINKDNFFRVEYQSCWKSAWCDFQKPCPCHLQLNFAGSGKVGDCLTIVIQYNTSGKNGDCCNNGTNDNFNADNMTVLKSWYGRQKVLDLDTPHYNCDNDICDHNNEVWKILSTGRHPTSSLWWTRLLFQSIHQSYRRCDNNSLLQYYSFERKMEGYIPFSALN